LAGRFANRKVFEMRTFVIEGKPLEEVTIKVKGQSLTLTEGVEVTVIVVVASQQSFAVDETHCACKDEAFINDETPGCCGNCGKPFRH
jgi:hypothetical protein